MIWCTARVCAFTLHVWYIISYYIVYYVVWYDVLHVYVLSHATRMKAHTAFIRIHDDVYIMCFHMCMCFDMIWCTTSWYDVPYVCAFTCLCSMIWCTTRVCAFTLHVWYIISYYIVYYVVWYDVPYVQCESTYTCGTSYHTT